MSLAVDDACDLAAAWIDTLAGRRGIRSLLIKGRSLSHHGLREPRVSADVDVLVEPARFEELCSAVQAAGWRERQRTAVGAVWADHSRTFIHSEWPCDIDVHRYFPGFLEDRDSVFETLWAGRESMCVAHHAVAIPSRNASILITILHQLRDGRARVDQDELSRVTSATLTSAQRRDLASLALATGALEPAREVLLGMGMTDADLPRRVLDSAVQDWTARIEADASGAYYWLLLIRSAPLGARAGLLMRALWPPRSDLLINDPGMTDTPSGRLKARVARLPKGMRGIPRAVRALRRR